jgi:hypothetical protein
LSGSPDVQEQVSILVKAARVCERSGCFFFSAEMNAITRRKFLVQGSAAAMGASILASCRTTPLRNAAGPGGIKPIRGSWISIWWDDKRHHYWNDTCLAYTEEQWQLAVKDVADIGFEYLVLLSIAKGGKAFYDTPLLPKLDMACADPIKALLTAGDRYGVKFFISSDWYAGWDERALLDKDRIAKRFQMMDEIVSRYGNHRSFHGWYWPNEAYLSPYFSRAFIQHVNECSNHARRITPRARTLTAPYGTYRAVCDDTFVRQLEEIDVDIIAYQDEVGRRTIAFPSAPFGLMSRFSHGRESLTASPPLLSPPHSRVSGNNSRPSLPTWIKCSSTSFRG